LRSRSKRDGGSRSRDGAATKVRRYVTMTGEILTFLHRHNRPVLLIGGGVLAIVLLNWIF